MRSHGDFIVGQYYHVFNRGVDKRTIFLDDNDRLRFLRGMLAYNNSDRLPEHTCLDRSWFQPKKSPKPLVGIVAYCLMPNHYHLLLTPETPNGISEFMRRLSLGYSLYFNKRHDRSGRLFQSVFKSEHINSDAYLDHITRYIHSNPGKLLPKKNDEYAIELSLSEYPWSSYRAYIGFEENPLLDINLAITHFGGAEKYRAFMREGIRWRNVV